MSNDREFLRDRGRSNTVRLGASKTQLLVEGFSQDLTSQE